MSSTTFIQSSDKNEPKDYVQELKAQMHRHCQLDWLEKFESSKQNPKIELNLLLDGTKRSSENDDCLLQRMIRNIIQHQREQRIIYTELLFRPELFDFLPKTSHQDLQRTVEIMISCIYLLTDADRKEKLRQSERVKDCIVSYVNQPLPVHVKVLLSCRWNSVEWLPEFIQLARKYPDDIVGIDVYGSEEECRNHWQAFLPYRKLLQEYHLSWQANIVDCTDQELLLHIVQGLDLQRLFDTYEIFQSKETIQDILIKYAVHLVVCPTSSNYKKIDTQANHLESTSNNDAASVLSNTFIHYLLSQYVNYSISSVSPTKYQQDLVQIYNDLLNSNQNRLTCEHMHWLNENALRNSFASQTLKTTLMHYLRENYANCYQQTLLLRQFQESTKKWEQEMNNIIDTNVQTAMDLAKKMQKENLSPPTPNEQHLHPESNVNEEDEVDEEEGEGEGEEEEEVDHIEE